MPTLVNQRFLTPYAFLIDFEETGESANVNAARVHNNMGYLAGPLALVIAREYR